MDTAPHQCMIVWATAEMHWGHGSRSLVHKPIHIPADTSIHTAWHVHSMKASTPHKETRRGTCTNSHNTGTNCAQHKTTEHAATEGGMHAWTQLYSAMCSNDAHLIADSSNFINTWSVVCGDTWPQQYTQCGLFSKD